MQFKHLAFNRPLGERLLPWGVGILFTLLYAATTAPSIVELFDDSLEFQLVLPTFGIAHPTGYPLYTLLGGLWSRLLFPFGNWAWRVNLLSALAAAATVALVFALAARLAAGPGQRHAWWAGWAAAIVFGLGPVWWQQATVAEVYALHNLLIAAILATVIGLEQRSPQAQDRGIGLLCLLSGLGLAHHRTVVLLAPGVFVYLLWRVPGIWRPRWRWLLWAVLILAPLLLYLYLPLRAGAGGRDLHGSYANTWAGFWDHVLARGYMSFLADSPLAVARTAADWLSLWLAQNGSIGFVLSLLGLGWLVRRRAPLFAGWLLLALTAAANLGFALFYQVGDQAVFLLPVQLCAAIFAGGGLALLLQWLAVRWRWVAGLVACGLLLIDPLRGPWIDRSHDWRVHDYAVDMAKVEFPPGSQVIGLEGELSALRYMQAAAGFGRSAQAVVADDPARRRAAIAAGLAAGAPVFLTREVTGIADQYSFAGAGPLVRVLPRGQATVQPPQTVTAAAFANGRLLLHGYDAERLAWAGGPALRVTFYWQPTVELTETLRLSLRVVTADDTVLPLADGTPAVVDQDPLRGVAPTPTWLPGAVVQDVHELSLPPPGVEPRSLLVILYDAATLAEAGRLRIPLE